MKKNVIVCVFLNALASICGWTALGLGISSVSSTTWLVVLRNPRVNIGLWYQCVQDFLCTSIVGSPWLNATRAFILMMVIVTVIGCLGNLFSQWKFNKQGRILSGGVFALAGFFGLIGCSLHTEYGGRSVADLYVTGYGFIVSWLSVGLLFLANLFNFFSAETMPLDDDYIDNNRV